MYDHQFLLLRLPKTVLGRLSDEGFKWIIPVLRHNANLAEAERGAKEVLRWRAEGEGGGEPSAYFPTVIHDGA